MMLLFLNFNEKTLGCFKIIFQIYSLKILHMHKTYLDHGIISTLPSSLQLPLGHLQKSLLHIMSLFVGLVVFNQLSLISAAHMYMSAGAMRHGKTYLWPLTPSKSDSPSPSDITYQFYGWVLIRDPFESMV